MQYLFDSHLSWFAGMRGTSGWFWQLYTDFGYITGCQKMRLIKLKELLPIKINFWNISWVYNSIRGLNFQNVNKGNSSGFALKELTAKEAN